MFNIFSVLIKEFLIVFYLLSSPIAETPVGGIPTKVYQDSLDNMKRIISVEFDEKSFEKLKFKKGTVVKSFSDLEQLEKDVFMLDESKKFSKFIRNFEKERKKELSILNYPQSEIEAREKKRVAVSRRSSQSIDRFYL